jgi:hypothetical protein
MRNYDNSLKALDTKSVTMGVGGQTFSNSEWHHLWTLLKDPKSFDPKSFDQKENLQIVLNSGFEIFCSDKLVKHEQDRGAFAVRDLVENLRNFRRVMKRLLDLR